MNKEIKTKLESKLGCRVSRCRNNVGSMKPYLCVRIHPPFEAEEFVQAPEIYEFVKSKLGFRPFFASFEGAGQGFTVEIEKRLLDNVTV